MVKFGSAIFDDRLIWSPVIVVVAAAALTTTIFTQEAPLTEVVFREVGKFVKLVINLNLVTGFDTTAINTI